MKFKSRNISVFFWGLFNIKIVLRQIRFLHLFKKKADQRKDTAYRYKETLRVRSTLTRLSEKPKNVVPRTNTLLIKDMVAQPCPKEDLTAQMASLIWIHKFSARAGHHASLFEADYLVIRLLSGVEIQIPM